MCFRKASYENQDTLIMPTTKTKQMKSKRELLQRAESSRVPKNTKTGFRASSGSCSSGPIIEGANLRSKILAWQMSDIQDNTNSAHYFESQTSLFTHNQTTTKSQRRSDSRRSSSSEKHENDKYDVSIDGSNENQSGYDSPIYSKIRKIEVRPKKKLMSGSNRKQPKQTFSKKIVIKQQQQQQQTPPPPHISKNTSLEVHAESTRLSNSISAQSVMQKLERATPMSSPVVSKISTYYTQNWSLMSQISGAPHNSNLEHIEPKNNNPGPKNFPNLYNKIIDFNGKKHNTKHCSSTPSYNTPKTEEQFWVLTREINLTSTTSTHSLCLNPASELRALKLLKRQVHKVAKSPRAVKLRRNFDRTLKLNSLRSML